MYSYNNNKFRYSEEIKSINIKSSWELLTGYDLIISAHCRQLFPDDLITHVRCINIHPGYNPDNRGWYPQIFSLINGGRVGATIHEIDGKIDHGFVIVQEQIKVNSWDTSLSLYRKILNLEMKLLKKNINLILSGEYERHYHTDQGNLNVKKDFNQLCHINLDDVGSFRSHLDLLRALSHGKYKNAYMIDDYGNKVFISINLKNEKND